MQHLRSEAAINFIFVVLVWDSMQSIIPIFPTKIRWELINLSIPHDASPAPA